VDEIQIDVGKTKEFLLYPDTLLNTDFHCYTWLCSYPSWNFTILSSTLVLHVSSREIKHTVSLAWKHNVTFCGIHM